MGHWTNSKQQILGSGNAEVLFDEVIQPGSQTALQDGIYDYSYHINFLKPSGEDAPGVLSTVLVVDSAGGEKYVIRESRSFGEINADVEAALAHDGRVPLSSGDRVFVRVAQENLGESAMTRIKNGQSSLTLDLVGGTATSGNFAGTSFPSQPSTSGQDYYRTDMQEKFFFTGSKWLGELRVDGAGRNNAQSGNDYLRRYNGQPMSASLGIYIPFDATIVSVSWTKGNTSAGNIEIRRDGTPVSVIDASATGGGVDLNDDFNANGVLSIYWASANSTNDFQVAVGYRRRG